MGRPACKQIGHELKYRADNTGRYCVTCSREKAKDRKPSDRREELIKRLSSIEGHCKDLFAKVQKRADARFDLSVEFLIQLWHSQNGRCAITDYPLDIQKGTGRKFNSPSLDRINPAAGYVQTNVRFLCDGVNMMKGTLSDAELRVWCHRVLKGLDCSSTIFVPNYNTVADLIDRLIVCTNKLSFFENKKRETQRELNTILNHPDFDWQEKVQVLQDAIVNWDNNSRNECETRNILKREIDRVLGEVIAAGEYKTLPDNRTFSAPPKSTADLLAEQCELGTTLYERLSNR